MEETDNLMPTEMAKDDSHLVASVNKIEAVEQLVYELVAVAVAGEEAEAVKHTTRFKLT